MADPLQPKGIKKVVLSVVTSYEQGLGNSVNAPYSQVTLNDLRLYNFASMGALALGGAYDKFALQHIDGQPDIFLVNRSYNKCVYQITLVDVDRTGIVHPFATSGTAPYTYTSNSTATKLAFDYSSLEALFQTLTLSHFVYTSHVPSGSDGIATAKQKVYAAYFDVTYDDASTQRYWATRQTVLLGGPWANGLGPAPGSPTDVLNPRNAVEPDENDTTYATIEATNKTGGILSFSALWNPAKLVLDWQLAIDCNNPPIGHVGSAYSHEFKVYGGTPPYSWAITGGQLPPGLGLSNDGVVSGIPIKIGTYSFELTVTEAGTTAALVKMAQAGTGGMSMATLTPGGSVQATASTAAYLGLNGLNNPYYGIAVAVAPPTTPAAGVTSYEVTAQAPGGTEKDFYQVDPAGNPVQAQTLLGNYGAADVTFRLYAVAADGTRTLVNNAFAGTSSQAVTVGATPTGAPNADVPTFANSTGTQAAASTSAVYMGTNSGGQQYWSIAVALDPQGVSNYVVTVQNTDASGTPGGTNSTERDFYSVNAADPPSSYPAQNLLGTYQADPASAYDNVTLRLYKINDDGSRTLLPHAFPGEADHQTISYGAAPAPGSLPSPINFPPKMVAHQICTITIKEGTVVASCGEPGVVTIGQAFSFRPTVKMGTIELTPIDDAAGTITWDVTGLPPGLIFDKTVGSATYGKIAGVATQPGTYTYTAVITSADGQKTTLVCSLTVEGPGFSEACGTPPVAPLGLPYSFAPPFAADTDFTLWTFSGLPPGLNWDSSSGTIVGTPSEMGAWVYTAKLGDASFVCSISVVAPGDSGVGACGSPGVLLVGIPFQFVPPFTSQAAIASWTFAGLPPGLGWDTDPTSATYGHIAGIPSAPGGYAYQATATDADGKRLTFTCSLVVRLPGDPDDGANDHGGKGFCWWLDLWVWQPVFAFSILNQQIQMPPAYQRALRYTLARELAGVYGRDPSIVAALASEAVAEVDQINATNAAAIEDPPAAPPAQG